MNFDLPGSAIRAADGGICVNAAPPRAALSHRLMPPAQVPSVARDPKTRVGTPGEGPAQKKKRSR
jgi:hypothetical protein